MSLPHIKKGTLSPLVEFISDIICYSKNGQTCYTYIGSYFSYYRVSVYYHATHCNTCATHCNRYYLDVNPDTGTFVVRNDIF